MVLGQKQGELVHGKIAHLPSFAPRMIQSHHGTRTKHHRVMQKNLLGKQDAVSLRGGGDYISVNPKLYRENVASGKNGRDYNSTVMVGSLLDNADMLHHEPLSLKQNLMFTPHVEEDES